MATSVGAGILLSRALGFVRERVFAHYFGNGPAADAFRAALRIPNVIRNLLGEGTLSASFIPVYAGMIERGDIDGARRLAGVVASLLVLLTALAALAGIALAPIITDFAAPGFSGATRDLTVTLVEILFPMSGILILSAWCLGVLNTHRRFFLSYAAPAVWNVAQIAVLMTLGGLLLEVRLAVALAWGALVGSGLQVALQLPRALRLAGGIAWGLDLRSDGVRRVVRAWAPVVFGAGAYQISSIVDTQLASLLRQGSVAILGYAQLIAMLPVSLFGVSLSAVALPELSRRVAGEAQDRLRTDIAAAARRLAFFVVPSAFALATLGREIVGALFQTGAFGPAQTEMAAGVLAAYAIGLPGMASVKLLASGHYALGDTKTPVRIAVLSVLVSAGSAFLLMQRFGAAGIALGASTGAYVNTTLNLWRLCRRVGWIGGAAQRRALVSVLGGATVAAVLSAWLVNALAPQPVALSASVALISFAAIYGSVTLLLQHPDALQIRNRMRRQPHAK